MSAAGRERFWVLARERCRLYEAIGRALEARRYNRTRAGRRRPLCVPDVRGLRGALRAAELEMRAAVEPG